MDNDELNTTMDRRLAMSSFVGLAGLALGQVSIANAQDKPPTKRLSEKSR